MRANVPRDRIRFCFPPMQHMGSMHSKLMLLKYERYMRIVVPTGNLMSFDWGETGTLENVGVVVGLGGVSADGCGRWCSSSTFPGFGLPRNGTRRSLLRLARTCFISFGHRDSTRSSWPAYATTTLLRRGGINSCIRCRTPRGIAALSPVSQADCLDSPGSHTAEGEWRRTGAAKNPLQTDLVRRDLPLTLLR